MGQKVEIFWCAPFSLDVPDSDPDISYCVDIINRSSLSAIWSRCQVNETQYSYIFISSLGPCTKYFIQVVANNPAGNSSVTRIFAGNKGMLRILKNIKYLT